MKKTLTVGLTFFLLFSFTLLTAAQEDVELLDPVYSDRPQGRYGGTLVSADLLSDPKTFNTIIANETSSTDIIDGFIFESLVEADGVTTELKPALARDWEFSEDGTVWTFHLRRGVQWNDGVEFTADDVVFTFNVIYDEDIPTSTRDVLTIDGEQLEVEKIDKYTVKMTLPKPYAPLLRNMPPIIPKHKLYEPWQEGKFNETWGINTDPREIVGTGPFVLAQYVPGERVVMTRNAHYWKRSPEGKAIPYLVRWIRQIAGSQETMTLMFENGDTHYTAIKNEDYERLQAQADAGNYTLYNGGPTFSTNFIVFNMNPDNPKLEEEPWKYEWFNNLHFRRAVAYAVDKDTIIDQVYAGLATPQWSPVSTPNKAFLNEDVKKYPYSLEKAREELEKGGFSWNNDGDLVDEEGRVVEFNMTTNAGNNERESIMNIVSNDLRELGMDVNASPVEFNKLVQQLTAEFDFDTILIGLTGSVEPNTGANVWPSHGQLHMWNPVQEEPATEWEARIDELFAKGATTLGLENRKPYYSEFQEIISEQVPVVYTVAPDSIFAVRNTLKNVEPTAYGVQIGGGVSWNVEELYLSQ